MTIKEYKEKYNGEYTDLEVYRDKFQHRVGFHSDRVVSVEDYSDSDEVIECSLMDKDEYSSTILANVGTSWEDFGFDDTDKILVLKINSKGVTL